MHSTHSHIWRKFQYLIVTLSISVVGTIPYLYLISTKIVPDLINYYSYEYRSVLTIQSVFILKFVRSFTLSISFSHRTMAHGDTIQMASRIINAEKDKLPAMAQQLSDESALTQGRTLPTLLLSLASCCRPARLSPN